MALKCLETLGRTERIVVKYHSDVFSLTWQGNVQSLAKAISPGADVSCREWGIAVGRGVPTLRPLEWGPQDPAALTQAAE